ncbi:hypothetical protein N7532_006647 [Penicillium argentinense]|uniref:Uncharacterized protein n=1 Tax=Penicillium argentinense TaxID=1131581 RepID=A0A9W9KBH3_9EURO|nr:uncharacterized protein N7532_006647 [Penicillium argentinense]KAJ5099646.1 hypothetical protein N7532_006647 [Penicillium argentinense]
MPNDRDNEDKKRDQENPRMPQDQDWEAESNPFVAFRRFADEQVSSLLQSVTGLPSSVSRPQSDRWTIFTDDSGYNSMKYRERGGGADNAGQCNYAPRDEGAGGSASRDQDNSNDNDNNGNNNSGGSSGSSQRRKPDDYDSRPSQHGRNARTAHSDFFGIESFFDRFEDQFLPFSSPFSSLFHPHQRFFFPDMFEDSNSPTWPLVYITFSPYSPLHLEHQAHYRVQRGQGVFSSIMSSFRPDSDRDPSEPQWREAFEDLLRLENGKPMLDEETLKAGKTENGTEWLHGLAKRGSLGDRWKYVSGGVDGHPWSGITFTGHNEETRTLPEKNLESEQKQQLRDDQDVATESELDVYERFLRDIEAREQEVLRGEVGSPLVRFLLEERRREQDQIDRYRRNLSHPADDQGTEDTESWLDLVSGGNRKSVPETSAESGDADVSQQSTPVRVISTISRTERKRLADGSVETKTVKTKRFTDGREETDESVEVTHPRSNDGGSGDKSKGGWFWKD